MVAVVSAGRPECEMASIDAPSKVTMWGPQKLSLSPRVVSVVSLGRSILNNRKKRPLDNINTVPLRSTNFNASFPS